MTYDTFSRVDWLKAALGEVPLLILHIRAQARPSMQASGEQRVSGSKAQTIAPLNIDPLDEADELWAMVCALAVDFAERRGVLPPVILKRQWIIQGSVRRVQGFASSDPERIYSDMITLTKFLVQHAFTLAVSAEYSVPVDELVSEIRKAKARHAGAPDVRQHRHRCPKCLWHAVVARYSSSGELTALECEHCRAARRF